MPGTSLNTGYNNETKPGQAPAPRSLLFAPFLYCIEASLLVLSHGDDAF